MNAAILIAGRELRDRSRLFLFATIMAAVPFVAALAVRDHRQTGIAMVAMFLAVAYSALVALTLGIAEKRETFLFARPVSPAAMWFGKTAAAVLLTLGAFAIVVLPTYLFARDGWRDVWRGGLAFYAILLCAALFFGGHVASTMLRSHSSRIVLDVAFAVLAIFAVLALLRPLLAIGGGDVAKTLVFAMSGAMLATLIAAPVWQLARGRIDAKQNHVALSTVLWGAVAIVLAVSAAYVRWVISPPLDSMTNVFALDQSPTGEWVYVGGAAPGRDVVMVSYLIDAKTGERERLPLMPLSRVQFSADGRVAAWMENEALLPPFMSIKTARDVFENVHRMYGTGSFRLHTRKLVPGAKSEETPLVVPLPTSMQLSPDGSRIALATGNHIEVYEVATARLLGVAPNVDRMYIAMSFVAPDLLRFEYRDELRELDVAHNKVATVGEAPRNRWSDDSFIIGQLGASRLLLVSPDHLRMRIIERATGKLVQEIKDVRSTPKVGGPNDLFVPRYPENATFVSVDRERHLVLWDARTGAKRPLL
jgi:hypothetical protein